MNSSCWSWNKGSAAFVTATFYHFNSKLFGTAGALQTAKMWQGGCLKAQAERCVSICAIGSERLLDKRFVWILINWCFDKYKTGDIIYTLKFRNLKHKLENIGLLYTLFIYFFYFNFIFSNKR